LKKIIVSKDGPYLVSGNIPLTEQVITTQVGLAETALTEAREFVLKVREILEDALGKDFMRGV